MDSMTTCNPARIYRSNTKYQDTCLRICFCLNLDKINCHKISYCKNLSIKKLILKDALAIILSEFAIANILCHEIFQTFALKSDSHLSKTFFIYFNESPLKLIKCAFYFILKALVLKIFKFLIWLFGHAKKRLDLKDFQN